MRFRSLFFLSINPSVFDVIHVCVAHESPEFEFLITSVYTFALIKITLEQQAEMSAYTPSAQQEVLVGDHDQLVSTTDLKGVITYCNDTFCRIAGFQADELLGKITISFAMLRCRKRRLPICGTTLSKGMLGAES